MTLFNGLQILIALGAVAPLVHFLAKLTDGALKYFVANTKHKNVQLFLGWVDQAVMRSASTYQDEPNEIKKAEAMDYVVKRLKANDLFDKFTNEQISAAIELAVRKLNEVSK